MQKYFGPLTIVLLLGLVGSRVLLMRSKGIQAMNFGQTDKKDFLIPPFAFFYFYLVSRQELFHSGVASSA
jgi:hypothetical protein